MTEELNNKSIAVDFGHIAAIGPVVELQKGPARTFRARIQILDRSGDVRFLSRKQFGRLIGSARACTPVRSFDQLSNTHLDKAAAFLRAAKPIYAALKDKNCCLQSDYFASIAQ